MASSRFRRGFVAWLAFLSLAVCGQAATWYEDYLDGVNAVERGKWDDAVRLLESARSQSDQSALRRKTYGLNFIEYLPNFYLGLAYLGRGNSARARECLEREESQGVVQKSKEAERFHTTLARLRAATGSRTPAAAGQATPAPAAVTPTRPPPPPATPPPATPRPIPSPTPATPVPRATPAPPVATPAAPRPPAHRPTPTALPRAAVRSTPAAVATSPPATPTSTPSPLFRDGLRALFRGELEAAIALLEEVPLDGSSRDADVHAYLAVAYARSALAEPDEERRAGREKKAVEHIEQARRLRPGYRLSERLVSPRVRELLRDSG